MLVSLKLLYLFIITLCVNASHCQRRIVGMNITTVEKRYMVYLIQSEQSHPKYNAWLCGGALVRTNKILTSAACLIETTNIYAIAGYQKYVSTEDLDKDNCTKIMKRRVIRICVPQGYNFNKTNSTTWMTLDIGVAVVEKAYRSTDELFRIVCDYAPKPIQILYHNSLTYEGQDVLAFGWGFLRGRRPDDPSDYNSKRLKYASYKLANKNECKKTFPGIDTAMDRYMLCARVPGVIDDDGRLLTYEFINNYCRRHGVSNATENSKQCSDFNDTINKAQMSGRKQVVFNLGVNAYGICQNDHGGPLVSYFGLTEMIIGIAVNTIYDSNYQCIGPSVYTSTACTATIIKCMLSDNPKMRRAYTNAVEREGFQIHERNVMWAEHSSDDSDLKMPTRNMNSEFDETTIHPTASSEDKEIENNRTS